MLITEARVSPLSATGDEVLTRNQYDPDGPLQEQVVTATEQHTAYDLREVMIADASGSTETIQATDEHPFYVEGEGFTGAAQLTVGEQIETADGSSATIVGNVDEPEPNGVTVYNFTVDIDHTYFVDQSGVAVWVHNNCPPINVLDIRPYSDFKNVVGDELAGHEILQNSWLKWNGGYSNALNPALALNPAQHAIVTAAQELGDLLEGPSVMKTMTAFENIQRNINILKGLSQTLGLSESAIEELQAAAVAFAKTLPS